MGDRTLTVGVLTTHVIAGPEIEIPVMSGGPGRHAGLPCLALRGE